MSRRFSDWPADEAARVPGEAAVRRRRHRGAPRAGWRRTPEEAAAAARELGRIAVKAQVPIGGRGKAGGIAVVDTPEEAQREAARILAMDIRGYPVRSVWCETGLSIDAELYLGITLDRDRRRLVIIFSAAGGMEIEQVAVEAPERIAKLWPDPFAGPQPYEIRQLAFAGLAHAPELRDRVPKLVSALVVLTTRLYEVATSLDAVTCEINPLVLTPTERSSPPTASSRSTRTPTPGTRTSPKSSLATRPVMTVEAGTILSRSRRANAASPTCTSTGTSAASATVPA